MLQVRDLSVEVGGRLTTTGASFSLHAGDKVGLVGRNGAGKTSLLKVISGEAEPAAGIVSRPRSLGYLAQDPPSHGAGVDGTALSHVLSGRGLDRAAHRLAAAARRGRRGPFAEEHPGLLERGRGRSATPVGTPPKRRCAASPRASGSRPTGSTCRSKRSPVGSGGGSSSRASCSSGDDLLLLDEPTNHLDVDAKAWLMGFLRTFRGALLVISHDLALLDQAITRILHLDDGELIEYKGTYSQYLVARKADEERQASWRRARSRRSGV